MVFFSKSKHNKDNSKISKWDAFYQRFEDRFRGSEALIRDKLHQRYEALARELCLEQSKVSKPLHLDLGCGRGELLKLCRDWGFEARGIDTNEVVAQRLQDQGFCVDHADILATLKEYPPHSIDFITCLHVIEHCPPQYFWEVTLEAFRCLKEGGVFLIETPSLYSLWASARQFFLDPTHQTPIHPDYLLFLLEDVGFTKRTLLQFDQANFPDRPDLVQLCSSKSNHNLKFLDDWLFGPMDIAVWAQK